MSSTGFPSIAPFGLQARLRRAGITGGIGGDGQVFFKYATSQAITLLGGTFTRPDATTCATYYDSAGVVQTAQANVLRDGLYLNGLRGTLLESTRTNLVLQSEDWSTTWAAVGTPTRVAATDTASNISLDTIGDDSAAALEGYTQTVTFTGDAVKVVSIFVKQGTSTSSVIRVRDTTAGADRLLAAITWSGTVPVVTMTTGTALGQVPLIGGVYRLMVATTAVTAANTNSLQFYPATDAALSVGNTGTILANGTMAENGLFVTSYIKNVASAVTRAADALSFAFAPVPQSMTLYVQWMATMGQGSGQNSPAVVIGAVGSSGNRFDVWQNNAGVTGGGTRAAHTATATTTLANAAALYDSMESMVQLDPSGNATAIQSLLGAAQSATAPTAGPVLEATFAAGVVTVSARNGSIADFQTIIRAIKIVSGVQMLAAMRAA